MSGKTRIAKPLIAAIKTATKLINPPIYDCFCGGLSIARQLVEQFPQSSVHCSDYDLDLVILYRALLDGWIPPNSLSKAEYIALKNDPIATPLRSYAAFSSFMGIKFSSYPFNKRGDDYYGQMYRSLIKDKETLSKVASIKHQSYADIMNATNSIYYCDIPYHNTTGWEFDHAAFYDWARIMSQSNEVYISEYVAPNDFKAIWQKDISTNFRASNKQVRTEKLFIYEPNAK